MQHTQNIIEYLNHDIGAAKCWVQSTPNAPINFPESKWKNILKRRAINLDKVYDALFINRAPQEEVASLRGHKIVFKQSSEVKKGVETSGEWESTWRVMVKATTFVFSHHQSELEKYGAFIGIKFQRREVGGHQHVFTFVKGVHVAIRGGSMSSLLNHKIHKEYAELSLAPDGIE
ncbi:hypothetical protein NP233_g7534 [Leucocoprinus birnbaumii]|uniref:Uncharacterized protein n=1 Tax=Leucocoprinus birnbaumii TaxID=56174 RepID=A0AAD5YSP2_9AGAR|nr:hypothetical protein NP233_g7534 [Leucocoprinus birnbaumii]